MRNAILHIGFTYLFEAEGCVKFRKVLLGADEDHRIAETVLCEEDSPAHEFPAKAIAPESRIRNNPSDTGVIIGNSRR